MTRTSSLSFMTSRAVSNASALRLARRSASARSRCSPLISSSDTPWRRRNGWNIAPPAPGIAFHAEARPPLLLGAERGEPGACGVRDRPGGGAGRPELEQSGHDAAVGRDALEWLGEGRLRRLQILLEPGGSSAARARPDTGVRLRRVNPVSPSPSIDVVMPAL
jgi:hypothetical protein